MSTRITTDVAEINSLVVATLRMWAGLGIHRRNVMIEAGGTHRHRNITFCKEQGKYRFVFRQCYHYINKARIESFGDGKSVVVFSEEHV